MQRERNHACVSVAWRGEVGGGLVKRENEEDRDVKRAKRRRHEEPSAVYFLLSPLLSH